MDSIKRELAELHTARVVFFCFLVIMLEGFDIQAAGVAAPKLAPAFGLQPAQLGMFFSSSAVGVLLFAAIGGILADRFGRKPVLIGATFAFGLACLLTPFCPGFEALIVVRFLTGAGLGGAMPVVIAMTSDHSPSSQKKRYVGIVYSAISLGGMFAAGIVAAELMGKGWQGVFYVGGILPMIIALGMVFFLPESHRRVAASSSDAGSWADIVGVAKLPITLSLWLATFLTLLVMYLLVMWMPSLLAARGLAKSDAAIVQMVYNLGSTVAALAAGYLLDRKLVFTVPVVGYVLLAIGLTCLGTLPLDLIWAIAVGFILGIAVTTGQTLLYAFAPLCYDSAVRNRGVGAAVSAGRVGTIVGPMLAGVLLGMGLTVGQVLLLLLPGVGVAMIMALLVGRLMQEAPAPAVQERPATA